MKNKKNKSPGRPLKTEIAKNWDIERTKLLIKYVKEASGMTYIELVNSMGGAKIGSWNTPEMLRQCASGSSILTSSKRYSFARKALECGLGKYFSDDLNFDFSELGYEILYYDKINTPPIKEAEEIRSQLKIKKAFHEVKTSVVNLLETDISPRTAEKLIIQMVRTHISAADEKFKKRERLRNF